MNLRLSDGFKNRMRHSAGIEAQPHPCLFDLKFYAFCGVILRDVRTIKNIPAARREVDHTRARAGYGSAPKRGSLDTNPRPSPETGFTGLVPTIASRTAARWNSKRAHSIACS